MKKITDSLLDRAGEHIGMAPEMLKKSGLILLVLLASNMVSFFGGKSVGESSAGRAQKSPIAVFDVLPKVYTSHRASRGNAASPALPISSEFSESEQSDTKDKNYPNRQFKETTTETNSASAPASRLFGSKKGKKFYYAGCSGAGRIKPQNKIYFKSEEEANIRGYTKAKGCK